MIPRQTVRRESGEVTVARNPCAALGDCKRRVLCVRGELSGCGNEPAQFQDSIQMIGTGEDHMALRMRTYFVDCRDRRAGRSGRCEYPGVGHDPYEPDCNQNAERDRLASIHYIFKPTAMSRVRLFVRTMGVHQEIYVRHQQKSSSA